jgi:hypothetical protein
MEESFASAISMGKERFGRIDVLTSVEQFYLGWLARDIRQVLPA